jgi:hypothetical protein
MADVKSEGNPMAAILGPGANDLTIETPGVWVANRNSPGQVVISGASQQVASECKRLEGRGFRVVPLAVSGPFHTQHMNGPARKFEACLRAVREKVVKPKLAVPFSNSTATPYPSGNEQIISLLAGHIPGPVNFVQQIKNMYAAGARVFVEFGPRATLAKFIELILPDKKDIIIIPVNPNSNKKSSEFQMRAAAMKLAVFGVPLSNFDRWAEPNAHLLGRPGVAKSAKKPRGIMSLSAVTYVAPSTLRNREKVMNNGYKISGNVVKGGGPDLAEVAHLHNQVADSKRKELESKQQLEQADPHICMTSCKRKSFIS